MEGAKKRQEGAGTMSTKKMKLAVASVLGPVLATLAMLSMGWVTPPGVGDPLPNVTSAELARFLAGKAAFESPETVSDGLGPVFNENACVVCHNVGATGGGSTRLETRFGRLVNGQFDPMVSFGGSLIQDHGIGLLGGVTFVGEVVPHEATIVARRRTTPLFGLGLVDNVSDSAIQQIAEFEQAVTPETAGRVNIVLDVASGQQRVARFGWKCQQATLFAFSGDAYLNEMGVTTPMFPSENCPQGNCGLLKTRGLPPVPNDGTDDTLHNFNDFMTFLKPPPQGPITQQVQEGASLFIQSGCINCHTPVLRTGPNTSAALDEVTFFPFSDFLLHDMGSLGDGIAQAGAGRREMRTAPLWGARLLPTFLHDGRASNLTDAILAHDGQGRDARNRFAGLTSNQRANLIAFLNAL
jgi:CxxC motif-containing protein (DUF1111 family)